MLDRIRGKIRDKADVVKNDSLTKFVNKTRGYSNPVSGLGTGRDKGAAGAWSYGHLDYQQIESMYRTSWLARKGVDTPAMDMLRQGWTWGLTPDEQKQLDTESERLEADKHIRQALIWARLYGGAGIYIGTNDDDLSDPLDPEQLSSGGVTYLTSIPAHYLTAVSIELDPLSKSFGLPTAYYVSSSSRGAQAIHHSRIVRFIGNPRPAFVHTVHDSWGDSVLETVDQTISDFTAGQRGIGNLLQEASLDVISIKGMMDGLAGGGQEYMDSLTKRTQLNMDMKSSMNALLLDGEDSYEQKSATFANLHELGMFHLRLVAAAFCMPMTKFFGQSPQGLNSTGEGDERNYSDTISAEQESKLAPALKSLFGPIKASAGLAYDAGKLEFNPLRQMTEKEASELNERNAKTLEIFAKTQVVPDAVLGTMARGAIIEAEATWQGVRAAYEPYTDAAGALIGLEPLEPTQEEIGATSEDNAAL